MSFPTVRRARSRYRPMHGVDHHLHFIIRPWLLDRSNRFVNQWFPYCRRIGLWRLTSVTRYQVVICGPAPGASPVLPSHLLVVSASCALNLNFITTRSEELTGSACLVI